jgi:hypothetical protein
MEVGRACFDKCKSMGYEGALYYGIVKEYADTRGWGLWEAFREFVQNALDEMHEVLGRRPLDYPCKYIPSIDGVVIYDAGRGIATYNLYIGKSEKKPWQRGRFGEGLKIALLVTTANGIPVVVKSEDKEFVPTFAKEEVEGVLLDVFCICVRKLPSPVIGTHVYIYRTGDLCDKYWKRVVQGVMERKPTAMLASYESPEPPFIWRDLIDKSATDGRAVVYARDIYIADFKGATDRDACFSYNLFDVELDESRRIASTTSIRSDIHSFWVRMLETFEPEKVGVDENQKRIKEALKGFLECVIGDCMMARMFESLDDVFIGWWVRESPDRQRKLRLLLDEIIGKDKIIIYDRELSELATYLNIPHVYCPTFFGRAAQGWFDIDKIIEAKIKEMEKEIVPRDRIEPKLRERLEILEEMAKIVFEPPYEIKVEYMIADPELLGKPVMTPAVNMIIMNLRVLSSACEQPHSCIRTFMMIYAHELAHIISRARDLTAKHLRTLSYIAGDAVTNAIKHNYSLSPLLSKLHQTYR